MKKLIALFLIFSSVGFSQVTNEGQPLSWSYASSDLLDVAAITTVVKFMYDSNP